MTSLESKFIFVPAISEEIINKIWAGEFNLNWWGENAMFQHRAGLLSSYYLYNRTDDMFQEFRERIRYPRNSLLVADSIGYELFSEKAKNNHAHNYLIKELTPQKILSIQEAIADIGIISDIPPYLDSAHYTTPAFFQEAMLKTSENTKLMLENRKSKHLKLYGVLQGKESDQLANWWQTMKYFKVDGWALAAKSWHAEWYSDWNKEIEDLEKKAKLTESEIAFFERKANKLLFDIFQNSNWYPECQNDLNKGKCDHCMDCWSKECNQVNCDRVGRCMCLNSSCICLGRY